MKSSNKNNNNKTQVKMKSKEIKKRIEALEQAVGEVVFTERQFVFNQLFMDYIRMNDITSQGKTYEEIHPNIVQHYKDFESISKGYRANKFDSFLDEVNDYLMDCVRAKELTDTELHEKTRQDAYDLLSEDFNFLEDCLGRTEDQLREQANNLIKQAYELIDEADSSRFVDEADELFDKQLRELGREYRLRNRFNQ